MAFEQSGLIGGLSTKYYQSVSNRLYRRVVQQYYRSMSNKLYRRVVQQYYRSMSNKLYQSCLINFDIGESPMSFQKQKKNLLFWKQFSYMENACVRESVRTRDMGHGMWTFM